MGSDGLVSLSVEQGAEACAYTALLEERLSLAMLYEAWHAAPPAHTMNTFSAHRLTFCRRVLATSGLLCA